MLDAALKLRLPELLRDTCVISDQSTAGSDSVWRPTGVLVVFKEQLQDGGSAAAESQQ